MPTFTPDQIAEVAADRVLGLGPPGPTAARWRLVLADPDAAPVARAYEARLARLHRGAEDPVARYERLTGSAAPPPGD